MLEAEARLGQDGGGGGSGGITVDQLLAQVRHGAAAAQSAAAQSAAVQPVVAQAGAPSRVLLRFDGESVQPNPTQVAQLDAFASGHGGSPVVVTSHADSIDEGAKLLDQRRAIAVSRELTGTLPDVTIRFDPDMPADLVVVSSAVEQADLQ